MPIETVAIFHAFAGKYCAWSCAEGVSETLSRLGYGVVDFGLPASGKINLDTLKRVDLVLMLGLEHFAGRVADTYGAEWLRLKAPKVAWYTESAFRDDRNFDYGGLRILSDIQYYPAIQDAEMFGGRWLPFGADTEVFCPKAIAKVCEAGFVGSIYPKRAEFLQSIKFPLTHIQPQQDSDVHKSFDHLARAYCAAELFLNLPAYSRLLVSKVTEVMACGTMIVTPRVDHPSGVENMRQFDDGRHLVYYDQSKPDELRDILQFYASNKAARHEIAAAGLQEVLRSHSLADRVRKIIADIEYGGKPAAPSTRPDWSTKKHKLKTAWGTLVYFDPEARLLRHGATVDGPDNLHLTTQNLRGRIVAQATDGAHRRLSYAPASLLRGAGETSGQLSVSNDESLFDFEMAYVDGDQIYLRHENRFLSADPDGVIRNDRAQAREHETFTLVETA